MNRRNSRPSYPLGWGCRLGDPLLVAAGRALGSHAAHRFRLWNLVNRGSSSAPLGLIVLHGLRLIRPWCVLAERNEAVLGISSGIVVSGNSEFGKVLRAFRCRIPRRTVQVRGSCLTERKHPSSGGKHVGLGKAVIAGEG